MFTSGGELKFAAIYMKKPNDRLCGDYIFEYNAGKLYNRAGNSSGFELHVLHTSI